MNSKQLVKLLKQHGWYEVNQEGSHLHFKHPTKKNKITVPVPKKDYPQGTLNAILKQAGLK